MAGIGELRFTPSIQDFVNLRNAKPITILAGANNTGKSATLKYVKKNLQRNAYMIGLQRLYHIYHISTALKDKRDLDNWESNFNSNFNQEDYNYEQNYCDLNRVIVNLNDTKRKSLLELCSKLLHCSLSMKKVEEDNDLSPRYIDMDGKNISVGSTGVRLLITLLGICMNEQLSTILIDEPEFGLSPAIQLELSSFFQNMESRKQYFPHLKQVFMATHSHVFLDRKDIANNFIVSRDKNNIILSAVTSFPDFHKLQFNLLGNALETMFFPSAIVVVEGKTDHAYLERLSDVFFHDKHIIVIKGNGDVSRKVHSLREAFGDLQKSPLQSRIFVVLDKINNPGTEKQLEEMGIPKQNIIKWLKNGIEYLYPSTILSSIFSCSPEQIVIDDDKVTLNGLTKTKVELCEEITRHLTSTTVLPRELTDKFLTPLKKAIE